MEAPKHVRRWFSFTLRTLFVVVTIGCVWLGWQVNIVQHRKSLVRDVQSRGGHVWLRGEKYRMGGGYSEFGFKLRGTSEDHSIVRQWLLGDPEVEYIEPPEDFSDAERESLLDAFPNVSVLWGPKQ